MRVAVVLLAVVVVVGMVECAPGLQGKLMRLKERMETRRMGKGKDGNGPETKRRWRRFVTCFIFFNFNFSYELCFTRNVDHGITYGYISVCCKHGTDKNSHRILLYLFQLIDTWLQIPLAQYIGLYCQTIGRLAKHVNVYCAWLIRFK